MQSLWRCSFITLAHWVKNIFLSSRLFLCKYVINHTYTWKHCARINVNWDVCMHSCSWIHQKSTWIRMQTHSTCSGYVNITGHACTHSWRSTCAPAGAAQLHNAFNSVIQGNKLPHLLWQANVLCFTALCPAGLSYSKMLIFPPDIFLSQKR